MAAPGVEQISVQCSCGKRLKAPASAVGKKAKCPKCGNVLTIQAPPPPADDGLDALYELAETEKSVATDANVPRCPGCMSPLAAGAVLCTTCGFDTRSGKRLATQKERPAGAAAAKRGGGSSALEAFGNTSRSQPAAAEAPAAEGNWFVGVLLGLAFAFGAGLVYGAILHFLDGIPFIGWSVLLVGWLAGVGVDKGYKGGNAVAGFTAAGVTLVVVIAVQLIVLVIAVVPVAKKAAEDIQQEAKKLEKLDVAEVLVEDQIKQQGLSRATISSNQLSAIERDAFDKAENLSDADYAKYKARLDPIETKVHLYNYVHSDVMKEMHIEPFGPASDQARADAQKEAWKRVDALSPLAQKTKLNEYQTKARSGGGSDDSDDEDVAAAKSAAAAKAKSSSSSSSASSNSSSGTKSKGSGINASLVGFGIVFGLLLLAWFFLPVLVAMALAYKVAANA